MSLLRSMLFVPADDRRKIEKALGSTADAVILDLEDAVAIGQKVSARRALGEFLEAGRPSPDDEPAIYVRVNALATEFAALDFQAVAKPGVAGIVLPKSDGPSDVTIADFLLREAERHYGLALGSIGLMPLIESAAGVSRARRIIEASPRVRRVLFGAGDFTLDIGTNISADGSELHFARSVLVVESRAAGIEAPIDTPTADFRQQETLERDTLRARMLGFGGKLLIHPNQIDTANRIFAPSAEQVRWAEATLTAFEKAEAVGKAVVEVDGRMIDYVGVTMARKIADQAKHIRARNTTWATAARVEP